MMVPNAICTTKVSFPSTLYAYVAHEAPFYTCFRLVKPVQTPVAIFGSLGVCIYGPASRHWLISYSPILLT